MVENRVVITGMGLEHILASEVDLFFQRKSALEQVVPRAIPKKSQSNIGGLLSIFGEARNVKYRD